MLQLIVNVAFGHLCADTEMKSCATDATWHMKGSSIVHLKQSLTPLTHGVYDLYTYVELKFSLIIL